MLNVCEVFEGIQGEGRYIGHPRIFVRLSGCNRRCDFCDTKYHVKGEMMSPEQLGRIILQLKEEKGHLDTVVFTGGEPLLAGYDLFEFMGMYEGDFKYELETNGDLLKVSTMSMLSGFSHITVSPKEIASAKYAFSLKNVRASGNFPTIDIKVVTNACDSFPHEIEKLADYLMPKTEGDWEQDKVNYQRVWDKCMRMGKIFCPRIHQVVWDAKRGV